VIAGMVQQRKYLEVEQTLKRKSSATAKSQKISFWSMLLLIMVENSMVLIADSLLSVLNPFLSISNNTYSLSYIQDDVLML
jgi:hypothetical protein